MRHECFTADDKAFVESAPFFFMATADEQGRPDCSFKGGIPGFVKVPAPDLLVFPDYDGNGMFKSLGNLVREAKYVHAGIAVSVSLVGRVQGLIKRLSQHVLVEADAVVTDEDCWGPFLDELSDGANHLVTGQWG